MNWRLINSGARDAAYNMALDEAIAAAVRRGQSPPTLRFYSWSNPSVSIGAFQKSSDVNISYCNENNIPIVRRPTGGRAVLHAEELTYSFSAKNEGVFSGGLLATYKIISSAFQTALHQMGLDAEMKQTKESGSVLTKSPLCFHSSSYGELKSGGSKLIGSAQKRWTDGFLQQGSIPYSVNTEMLKAVFIFNKDDSVQSSITGLQAFVEKVDENLFKQYIKDAFEKIFGFILEEAQPSRLEEKSALQLMQRKYLNQERTLSDARRSRFCSSR
jgi:lipoate-protein ligase A